MNGKSGKKSIVKDKSYVFALEVIQLSRTLRMKGEYELGGQLIRSGTSIGANIEEALAGISRRDFVVKMGIASKEARETYYWLRLVRDSGIISLDAIHPMIEKVHELIRMLTAIVKTGQTPSNSKLNTQN